MSAHAIANKFRRALRNGTGANFTYEQLREMAGYGVLIELARIEANELCPVAERAEAIFEAPQERIPVRGAGNLDIAYLSRGL